VSSPRTHAADAHCRPYRFGDFTLDLDDGFLRRGDEEVALRPKSFQVLTYLVERHGRIVTKTELIDAIWPDAAVTDNSLAQCLLEIRRALADESQQKIRTVARRGYIFAAPVTTPPAKVPRTSSDAVEAQAALSGAVNPTAAAARRWKAAGVLVLCAVIIGGIFALRFARRSGHDLTYTQLTDFTDSAVAPALSPDGRMFSFIRGNKWFGGPIRFTSRCFPTARRSS